MSTLFFKMGGGSSITAGSIDNAVLRADGTGGATLQNSAILIGDASTATANNVQIAVNHAGQTNSSLVLNPMGSGAIIIGPPPDGTATGGNARGAGAVDLGAGAGVGRSVATQVASGAQSFLLGGFRNSAITQSSGVLGGSLNTASGINAVVIGGATNTASATHAIAHGAQAAATRQNMRAHGGAQISTPGDKQAGTVVMGKQTANATPTELTLDGSNPSGTVITSSNRFILGVSQTVFFDAYILGRSNGGTDNACYHRRGCIKRDGSNNTALVGAIQTIGTDIETDAAWDVTIQADDTNDALQILVTGSSSLIVNWTCELQFRESIRT